MSDPIRMCINCRNRALQTDLIRLQCEDRNLTLYTNFGRSFYLCYTCFEKKEKKLQKSLSRACKKEIKITDLENLIYG
ncbi:MAG: DUF448 domain-containing protein [Epsilonproteobacteria bacterium]|nr:DUF448 domain-containing protein [Campylobacterota bacterium]